MRRDIMMLELILDSTLKITVLLIMYSGEKSVQSVQSGVHTLSAI